MPSSDSRILRRTAGSWADRLVGARPGPAAQGLVGLVCVVSVVAIGVVDAFSGTELSFAILYFLPVVVVALVVGTAAGCALSAVAVLVWLVAERQLIGPGDPVAVAWNGLGRLLTMCVVVVLLGALRETVARLAESERTSREFLATAAHQLRTPIAGLVASAEALATEPDPDVRAHLVDNLVAGTDRSRRLLSSLLEISRLDQAAPVLHRPVDLAELCRRELETASFGAAAVELRYEGPRELVAVTGGDSVREALSNVVDNALRHARSLVTVSLVERGGSAVVAVTDDGPGVPRGSEELVFDRFVSLDRAGGSGLGLPIARASLRALGGDVTLRGGAFVLEVPAAATSR